METHLADWIRDSAAGREAEAILRACVHCGFCTATCPTYQLLGDELDGPRGRVYLIKQLLEGQAVSERTRLHLDRCLTCRSCETTCPSGVRYHRLLDIGRQVLEERLPRPVLEQAKRRALAFGLTQPVVFRSALALGRVMRPLLPQRLASKVPSRVRPAPVPEIADQPHRRMLLLEGCVQPALAPAINAATRTVLGRLGIGLESVPGAGCCGAIQFHLGHEASAEEDLKRLIDHWWPWIEDQTKGVEAIVLTASGCAAHLRDAADHLRHDAGYRAKAGRVVELVRDVAEIVLPERALLHRHLKAGSADQSVAWHAPCTLQHGLRVRGVEFLLSDAGFDLVPVTDGHLCCGSAGTYSLLQPKLSEALRTRKLAALRAGSPDRIASGNIGCLTHLAGGSALPVNHWIELIAERLAPHPG